MAIPNWANRSLWTGDNLDIMRGMNSESVDLIYLDPPFNSNRDYAAPIGSEAAGAAFKDTWTLDDVDEAWHGEIADRDPALYATGCDSKEHGHENRQAQDSEAWPPGESEVSGDRPHRRPTKRRGESHHAEGSEAWNRVALPQEQAPLTAGVG